MRWPVSLRHLMVLMCLIVLARLLYADVVTDPAFVVEPSDNPKWIVSGTKRTAIYVDDKKSLETPQLILDRGGLGVKGWKFTIRSDASKLRLRDDEVACEIPVSGDKTDELFFTSDDADGKIVLNGTEHPELQGKWIQIVAELKGNLRLQFVGASFVNVRYQSADAASLAPQEKLAVPSEKVQSEEKVAPVKSGSIVPTNPAAASQPPGVVAGDPLHHAVAAVFKLLAKDASRETFCSGTAFLVSADGLAVTNFHVVEGASGGTAVFDGGKRFPLELIAAQPQYDLAVVKVQAKPSELPPSLSLAEGEPEMGSDVWAIGYPEFGLTVTKGIVGGLRQFSQLPIQCRKIMNRYAQDSTWIQTDCTINHGNSGGPLVAKDGTVVGVNTWHWPLGDNLYFAMDIRHAQNLLRSLPSAPITFSGAVRKYGGVVAPSNDLPVISIAREKHLAEISQRMAAFASGIVCRKCSGKGTITMNVQVGTERVSAILERPITKEETSTCPECQGKGYNVAAFTHQASELVDVIARANPSEQGYDKRLHDAAQTIWTVAGSYPDAFSQLDLSKEWGTGSRRNARGLPIMGVGRFEGTVGNDEDGADLKLVSRGHMLYVISQASLCDAEKGDDVVFGGLFAGEYTLENGDSFPVLQYGFAFGGGTLLPKSKIAK